MTVFGVYTIDENWVTMFSDNTIYTIARNGGEWGSIAVGDVAAGGGILTQEAYNEMASKAERVGTIVLN